MVAAVKSSRTVRQVGPGASAPWVPLPNWGLPLMVGGLATISGIVLALAGTLTVEPGVDPWPRFWATVYFVLLFWPVGLLLAGRIAGWRVQAMIAGALVFLTALQQSGLGTMPLPQGVRWSITLAQPGDAIRQRIVLPPPADRAWQRAWREAAMAAVTICTWEPVAAAAGVTVTVNNLAPVALGGLAREGEPNGWGWYSLPISASTVRDTSHLDVVVRREGNDGPPAMLCGGRDDPGRPGAGGAARWSGGRWDTEHLADHRLLAANGRPASGRYLIELRFFDTRGLPTVGIWY
jgi:hypothetical protein